MNAIPKLDMREVRIDRESTWRESRRKFRSFDSQPPNFIEFADLYRVLAHGAPGYYVLRGA